MQLNVIILLFSVDLSGSEYIYGKKRACLLLSGYDNEVGFVKSKKKPAPTRRTLGRWGQP